MHNGGHLRRMVLLVVIHTLWSHAYRARLGTSANRGVNKINTLPHIHLHKQGQLNSMSVVFLIVTCLTLLLYTIRYRLGCPSECCFFLCNGIFHHHQRRKKIPIVLLSPGKANAANSNIRRRFLPLPPSYDNDDHRPLFITATNESEHVREAGCMHLGCSRIPRASLEDSKSRRSSVAA